MNLGTTAAYGKLHQPSENTADVIALRELCKAASAEIAAAYGWIDMPTTCGFGLEYLDTEDGTQLPDAMQERIDNGDLFFFDADEAINFESQLRSYEAIKGKKKLPWRYRWPDEVRDDVLARLLALNAERYAEEVAQGLHKKGKKSAASTAGQKRGRPAKAAPSESSEQMGLGL